MDNGVAWTVWSVITILGAFIPVILGEIKSSKIRALILIIYALWVLPVVLRAWLMVVAS